MQRQPTRVFVFAIFCTFLAALAWYGARWVEEMPQRFAAATEARLEKRALRLREQFFALANFQPRVRVNQRVIAETTSEIAEFALLEKDIEVQNEFTHTWAGSTKTIRLRGKYSVKCGYRLLDRFEIQVEHGQARVLLPAATILSVEQKDLKVEALEEGLWNPISAGDVQDSITALQELARSRSGSLLPQVNAGFTERLHRLLGEKVELRELKP